MANLAEIRAQIEALVTVVLFLSPEWPSGTACGNERMGEEHGRFWRVKDGTLPTPPNRVFWDAQGRRALSAEDFLEETSCVLAGLGSSQHLLAS